MKLVPHASLLFAVWSLSLFAAEATHVSIAQMQDSVLSKVEHEMISLAEAMPAEKYNFAPTNGEFKDVRTFGQQMSHTATTIYQIAARILGENCPVEEGKNQNGSESLKSKEAIVRYLKDAFAYGHKAASSLTQQNFTEELDAPWGKTTIGRLAEVLVWHSYDHYGQAAVYARMNGVIPPASRGQ